MLTGKHQSPLSGQEPKQLVILLHGLGANADDLFSLIPYFSDILPDAHFTSLDAPYPCDMAAFGLQWFSLQDRSEEAIISGIEEVMPALNHYIDEAVKEHGLEDGDVALIGFSQGAMLSKYTAVRRSKPIAGVLAYSGALVGAKDLKDHIVSKPPVCVVHGEEDEVVPFEAFSESVNGLQAAGVEVHGYSREDLGHGIDPAGVQIGREFLKTAFAS